MTALDPKRDRSDQGASYPKIGANTCPGRSASNGSASGLPVRPGYEVVENRSSNKDLVGRREAPELAELREEVVLRVFCYVYFVTCISLRVFWYVYLIGRPPIIKF